MRVNTFLESRDNRPLAILREECNQFLYQSGGLCLIKSLPDSYADFQKVKVRKRKKEDLSHFNEAFAKEYADLRQRAIFTNGTRVYEEKEGFDKFLVFPIDGYRFLYSKEVTNSSDAYHQTFESLLEIGEEGTKIINDMLRFSYVADEKLVEGIVSGAEIIIYNIPYFYAVRASTVDSYEELWNKTSNEFMEQLTKQV